MNNDARLYGTYKVFRYDRKTGAFLGTLEAHNAIQANGRNLLLDVGIGDKSDTATNGDSELEIVTSSSGTYLQNPADSGFPSENVSAREVTWQWSHDTGDSYTVDTLRFNQTTSSTTFSEVTSPFGDNSKPSTENWIYQYTLSIDGSGGTLGNFESDGLHYWLQLWAGIEDFSWNSQSMTLKVSNGDTSYIPHNTYSRSGDTVTWEFVAGSGSAAHSWTVVEIGRQDGPQSLNPILRGESGAITDNTKPSDAEWTYTYNFTLST